MCRDEWKPLQSPAKDRRHVPVCWFYSPRLSVVTILSLHKRWQVWLSASRPVLKSRHSIHSLRQEGQSSQKKADQPLIHKRFHSMTEHAPSLKTMSGGYGSEGRLSPKLNIWPKLDARLSALFLNAKKKWKQGKGWWVILQSQSAFGKIGAIYSNCRSFTT